MLRVPARLLHGIAEQYGLGTWKLKTGELVGFPREQLGLLAKAAAPVRVERPEGVRDGWAVGSR